MLTLNKTLLSLTLAFGLTGLAYAQTLTTPEAKESYSLGASTGKYLSSQIYKQTEMGAPIEMDLVVKGFIDALKNKSELNDDELLKALNARADRLNKLAEAEMQKLKAENKAKSEAFLKSNGAKKGVKTTSSGLQYEVIAQGKGKATPAEEEIVTVEYVGKLADGTPFEGTDEGKKTEQFVVMSLVPGLKEGVSLMKEGDEYRFVIPAALAYGADGAGPIPPETALIFDVKLLKIEKPGAGQAKNPHSGMGMGGMMGGNPHEGQSGKKAWPHG